MSMDYMQIIEALRKNDVQNNCHDCALGYVAHEAADAIEALMKELRDAKMFLCTLEESALLSSLTSEICQDIIEHPDCTDKLRANMELIATKFQNLKAMKKGTISPAQAECYKDSFKRLVSLEKKNPDAKGWEKETTEIAARLM